jgi:hypothetical protein
LPLISTRAERLPVAEGLNTTDIVQEPFGSTGEPQVFVLTKSDACAPVTVSVATCRTPFPVFLTVTLFVSLEDPMAVLAKVTEEVDNVNTGGDCASTTLDRGKTMTRKIKFKKELADRMIKRIVIWIRS